MLREAGLARPDRTAMPRVAVVSTTVPPGASGQARVLGQILGDPPPANCLLLADQSPFAPGTETIPANYRILRPQVAQWQATGRLAQRYPVVNALLGALAAVFRRAREIARHVVSFRAEAIVVCTASPFDIPACTLVALRHRIPLVVYLFDDPVYQWVPGPLRQFARFWEPIWSRIVANVIAPNETMAEEFARRRKLRPVIVRNSIAPEAFAPQDRPWPLTPGQFRIVYTGSVYHAQSDALLDLVAALEALPGWSLHIYTSQTEAELAAYGIRGPAVHRHPHVDQAESYAVQRGADLLFLPLAFRSKIQEVLRSSAPMKMGEYLASRRPILVHAPPETFIVRHLREHEAAFVVDTPDPAALTQAIAEIANDPARRDELSANALRLAETYRTEHARDTFWHTVSAAAARR